MADYTEPPIPRSTKLRLALAVALGLLLPPLPELLIPGMLVSAAISSLAMLSTTEAMLAAERFQRSHALRLILATAWCKLSVHYSHPGWSAAVLVAALFWWRCVEWRVARNKLFTVEFVEEMARTTPPVPPAPLTTLEPPPPEVVILEPRSWIASPQWLARVPKTAWRVPRPPDYLEQERAFRNSERQWEWNEEMYRYDSHLRREQAVLSMRRATLLFRAEGSLLAFPCAALALAGLAGCKFALPLAAGFLALGMCAHVTHTAKAVALGSP